ncbi:MAG: hypothetical protein GKR89_15020 [Candidatus Latescibacteria bacterium]|nr:hypothetical protein [Candidatus Latescibacterota bacterium]
MNKLRVAVVGGGGRGRGHMRELQSFDDVDLVAVCDPVEASRQRAGEEFGLERQYAELDEMLDREELDAAVVATPAHLNAPVALVCLQAGVPTLLEKPPGLSVAETIQLRDAAAAAVTGVQGMVGWNRRFHPIIVEARRLVEERGPVLQLLGQFHKSMSNFVASGVFSETMLDQMLLETPIHAIDTVRALAGGKVVEVHSAVRRANSSYQDVHAALVVFDNDCVAQLMANYTTDARLERYEIHGCDISAYLEGVQQGEVVADGKRWALGEAGTGGTREQARFFLDCVRDGRPVELPAANLDEAVATMELVEAIRAGLRD